MTTTPDWLQAEIAKRLELLVKARTEADSPEWQLSIAREIEQYEAGLLQTYTHKVDLLAIAADLSIVTDDAFMLLEGSDGIIGRHPTFEGITLQAARQWASEAAPGFQRTVAIIVAQPDTTPTIYPKPTPPLVQP